jgi:hypothetical protein
MLVLAYLGPAGVRDALSYEDIGQRFDLAALLLLFGSLKPTESTRWRAGLAALVLAFGLFKLHDAWRIHREHDRRAAAVSDQLLAQVPRHSRVCPLFAMESPTRIDHLDHRHGNYAVIERASYSPHVFARVGQQPLRHLAWGDYRPVARLELSDEEWAYYDFLLVQSDRAEPAVPGLAERTELLARAGDFRLYRVRREP